MENGCMFGVAWIIGSAMGNEVEGKLDADNYVHSGSWAGCEHAFHNFLLFHIFISLERTTKTKQ